MLSNFGAAKFDSANGVATPSTHPLCAFAGRCTRAVHAVRAVGIGTLRAALPQVCSLCAARSGDALLCAACAIDMPRVGSPCPRCALPSPAGATCGACLGAPPPYAMTIAAWCYAFPVDRLLQAFKYDGRLALAEPLAIALCDAARARNAPLPDRLLALPLSRERQRMRGFNQAQEIARRVASRIGVKLSAGLRRTRDSPPQAGLALAARASNATGAFGAVARMDGLSVAIVDDVMTTGATLRAAAIAARCAGAPRVEAWVVARTLPPSPGAGEGSVAASKR